MLEYVCYVLIRIFNFIFYCLPISFTLWLGRKCGRIAYLVNAKRRVIGYANLRAAFCREKEPAELKKLIKGVYRRLVEIFFEVMSLTKVNKAYVKKYIDIVNKSNIENAASRPNGAILLTAHFGNWELSGIISSIEGFPLVVLTREQKMKKLHDLITAMRESKGMTVVTKGITTKYILKALHQGRIIGMVGDQNAGKTGVFVDFFGRPASTAPGTARIAARTGAHIVPAFITRIKGPYQRLVLEDPMKIEKGEDITPYLEKYNKILEKYVRMYPDQWLWLHKRWKATPLRKVIVLNDGKPGHLNQALAVVKEIRRFRADSGYRLEDTETEVVDIKFKSNLAKKMLALAGVFSSRRCQGCMRCLKACLTKESYESLMRKYADIVISCGSGVTAVNSFFSFENNAKNTIIMKPSFLSLRKFDLVILPRHDRPAGGAKNVIITEAVPNLVDEDYLGQSAKEISKIAELKSPRRIGIFLGGDNSSYKLTEEITEELLTNMIDASVKLDADLLVTTSRRTPPESEKILQNRLRTEKRCRLLVIANDKNIPNVTSGILGLCDTVVVSGESASMVSEAVASGKKVIVFRLEKKSKKFSKFEDMLNNLENKGYIVTAEVEKLSDAICRSLRTSQNRKSLPDRENIYNNIYRLL